VKDSTKTEAKGKVNETKGKLKAKAGRATNNPNLEARGQDEQVSGKLQKKIGQIKKVFGR
jgi:uncharacterized protein YjbJ (UPF0337 family)